MKETTEAMVGESLTNVVEASLDQDYQQYYELSQEYGQVELRISNTDTGSETFYVNQYENEETDTYIQNDQVIPQLSSLESSSLQLRSVSQFDGNSMILVPMEEGSSSVSSSPCNTSYTDSSSSVGSNQSGDNRLSSPSSVRRFDEDRIRIRRQKNRQAAARCHQKRIDRTNQLIAQTNNLEERQAFLLGEIVRLKKRCDQLTFALGHHQCEMSPPNNLMQHQQQFSQIIHSNVLESMSSNVASIVQPIINGHVNPCNNQSHNESRQESHQEYYNPPENDS